MFVESVHDVLIFWMLSFSGWKLVELPRDVDFIKNRCQQILD